MGEIKLSKIPTSAPKALDKEATKAKTIEIIEEIKELQKTNKTVGIDLGLKSFVITSDGKEFENNKKFRN